MLRKIISLQTDLEFDKINSTKGITVNHIYGLKKYHEKLVLSMDTVLRACYHKNRYGWKWELVTKDYSVMEEGIDTTLRNARIQLLKVASDIAYVNEAIMESTTNDQKGTTMIKLKKDYAVNASGTLYNAAVNASGTLYNVAVNASGTLYNATNNQGDNMKAAIVLIMNATKEQEGDVSDKLYNAAKTELERTVASIAGKRGEDCEGFVKDVLSGGCINGTVGELIYTGDCVNFYQKHKKDIQSLVKDLMNDCGIYSLKELFGDKFDSEDPFCEENENQNLLAWFGFEEALRLLADRIELDI